MVWKLQIFHPFSSFILEIYIYINTYTYMPIYIYGHPPHDLPRSILCRNYHGSVSVMYIIYSYKLYRICHVWAESWLRIPAQRDIAQPRRRYSHLSCWWRPRDSKFYGEIPSLCSYWMLVIWMFLLGICLCKLFVAFHLCGRFFTICPMSSWTKMEKDQRKKSRNHLDRTILTGHLGPFSVGWQVPRVWNPGDWEDQKPWHTLVVDI